MLSKASTLGNIWGKRVTGVEMYKNNIWKIITWKNLINEEAKNRVSERDELHANAQSMMRV